MILRILIFSFIIINTIIIIGFYSVNNIMEWLMIIILINILFPLAIINSIYLHRKELFLKRFVITDEYVILPYISGIKIPDNKIFYSSIKGQVKKMENQSYFILVIDINDLKRYYTNLSKIPQVYNLELDEQTIRVHNNDNSSLSILIDKTDFSQESFNQLIQVLTNKNLLHDVL